MLFATPAFVRMTDVRGCVLPDCRVGGNDQGVLAPGQSAGGRMPAVINASGNYH